MFIYIYIYIPRDIMQTICYIYIDIFLGTLCKPIGTVFANNNTRVWEWFVLGLTNQSKTKQDKAMRHIASAREEKKDVW